MKEPTNNSLKAQCLLKNYLMELDLAQPLSTQLQELGQFLTKSQNSVFDFNEVLCSGPYQGSTILQVLLLFASNPEIGTYLTRLLKENLSQLDFGYIAKDGLHHGKNAFALIVEHFCYCTLSDENLHSSYPALLKILIASKTIGPQLFNAKLESGFLVKKSILAWLISKAVEFPEIIDLILKNYDFAVFNFHEKIHEEDETSQTILQVLVESILNNQITQGIIPYMQNHKTQDNDLEDNDKFAFWIAENLERYPQLVHLILYHYDLTHFNFNKKNINGDTPLWIFTFSVIKNLNRSEMLIHLIEKIPDLLDFNITTRINRDSKMTLFNALCRLMCNIYFKQMIDESAFVKSIGVIGCDQILETIINEMPCKLLNYNAPSTGGAEQGRTAFWYITKLAQVYPSPLQAVMKKSSALLNFNIQDMNGISPLWNIVMAAQKQPELLQMILQQIPIESLDFSIKTVIPTMGELSIIEWMKSSDVLKPFAYNIAFSTQLREVWQYLFELSRISEMNTLSSTQMHIVDFHFAQLEYHAKVAECIYPEFQLQVALLYEEFGLKDKLQRLVLNIDKNNPCLHSILERLTSHKVTEKEKEQISLELRKLDKDHIYEDFLCALKIEPKNNALIRDLALKYVYNKSYLDSDFVYDPILDNLADGKNTSLFLIETERKRVKLQWKIEQAKAETKRLNEELNSLKVTLGV